MPEGPPCAGTVGGEVCGARRPAILLHLLPGLAQFCI